MNLTRAASVLVVVLLVLAGGILGLRSWVGVEEGERLAGEDLPGLTPSATPSGVEPTPSSTPTASTSASPSPSRTPRPSATPTPDRTLASPSGIASDIEGRLSRTGRAASVSCPQAVPVEVGTAFTCEVAYADEPLSPVADATVNIVGPDLRYVWSSTPR